MNQGRLNVEDAHETRCERGRAGEVCDRQQEQHREDECDVVDRGADKVSQRPERLAREDAFARDQKIAVGAQVLDLSAPAVPGG